MEKEKPIPERRVEVAPRADAVPSAQRCPFCHAPVVVEPADWVACAGCLARHHEACWDESGRCAACAHEVRLRADAPRRRPSWFLPVLFAASLFLGLVGLGVAVTPAVRYRRSERSRPVPAEAPRPVAVEAPVSVDLRHVKKGQRYHYTMQNAMTQVWTVDAVGPNRVNYRIGITLDGRPIGDPTAQEWGFTPPAPPKPEPTPGVKQWRERVTVDGVEFDCLVSEASGYRTWLSMTPGSETVWTFPGCVKCVQVSDGAVVLALTRIEQP